jgi:hypothetical protein
MSIEKYKIAHELIKEAGGGNFNGPKLEPLVAMAETALALRFPPSYRRFLLDLGCGNFNGLEIYGVINTNFETSAVPNGIWLTLKKRRTIGLDVKYVIVSDNGGGNYYALDTKSVDDAGEARVVLLSVDGRNSEPVADSFGDFLLEAVKSVL